MAPAGTKEAAKRPLALRSQTMPTRTASDGLADRRTPTSPLPKTPDKESSAAAAAAAAASEKPDTFESHIEADDPPEPPRASVDLDDLPIELIGLTDSFIESLQAKVHPTPPSIETLSQKFQDFYAVASNHIATHIAALATRQSREQPPATPATTPRTSAASILRAKAASIGGREKTKPLTPTSSPSAKSTSEQQMITADELANRKRARRALEQKRGLLEEAVERRLCEGIYDRIYRHRTTQDEAQDAKLRSKTAALDVVGIGPADLGVDLGELPTASAEEVAAKQKEVRQWLETSRDALISMNQTHYPLGKLNRLKAVHKGIVDTLAHFHPSASADEIMPMLIYTLITLPPEQLNVVSDLNFIQRFRWEPKIEGEAAYCMTNLEAAISFLDTVDLSTLRADEAPSGPPKTASSTAATAATAVAAEATASTLTTSTGSADSPKTETFPPLYSGTPGLSVTVAHPTEPELSPSLATATTASPSPTTVSGLRATVQLRNRRLSDLVNLNTPAAQALSTASDAVMNTFNAADQGLKTIGNSLEGSYRLFFGKLGAANQQQQQKQEQQQPSGRSSSTALAVPPSAATSASTATAATPVPEVVLPKTLDDARKLVATPPPGLSEDELSANDESMEASPQQATPPKTQQQQRQHRLMASSREDRMLSLVGGRRVSASRDHSADSSRSAASSKRVAFAPDDAASETASVTDHQASFTNAASASTSTTATSAPAHPSNPALLDSVRNLGNSLNPMSRLTGISGFRGFGRTVSTPTVPAIATSAPADGGDLATAFPDLAATLPPKPVVSPPVKRFMELHNPADLRISEVLELLRDYRRLAGALKDLGAFKE